MLDRFLDQLLDQNGSIVYLIVGLVVLAEDALFIGFLLPGETAAILGGVAASRGNLSVVWLSVIVVSAAIIGDTIGYEIGARYGTRLLNLPILRKRQDRINAARDLLARRGGPAVFFARYIAFFRAIMPFLAGASHMHYRKFLLWNALGGLTWGVSSVLVGYLAGNSYTMIEHAFGRIAAFVIAGVVVVAIIAWLVLRHHRRAKQAKQAEDDPDDKDNGDTGTDTEADSENDGGDDCDGGNPQGGHDE